MTETYRTDYPTCPSCGHQHRDRDDFGDGSETECDDCGLPYGYERHVEVSFTTWPVQNNARPEGVAE